VVECTFSDGQRSESPPAEQAVSQLDFQGFVFVAIQRVKRKGIFNGCMVVRRGELYAHPFSCFVFSFVSRLG
jgi:hypothetical protein